ncbi:MAG TPA: RDD family protein [Lysobacter sp.]|jgi:uncharacterized RDD family membrane protein YckC|nr:RDD family protein [Lysobacter sp.]
MEQHNPYQSPRSVVADVGPQLAGRGARLGAALLDSVIMLAIVVPTMFIGGYFRALMEAAAAGEQVSILTQLLWGLIGLAIFIAVQFLPLKNSGQTWGKKIVGLKIVNMAGEQPGLDVLLGRRYLFANGISLIPFVGGLASLVNVLMIFRADKRCLHDLVAGTQVINAN